MASTSPPRLAILDDYHNISSAHLAHIPPSQLSITIFADTLPSYNHSSTTAVDQEAIVSRLQPFTVISTMRERTPFPATLLRQLPNLELILATGARFETFDITAAKELGIVVVAAPGKGRTDGKGKVNNRPKLDIKKGGGHQTAQHAWALILALARNVAEDDAVVKGKGGPRGWQTKLAIGLQGLTLGIIGLGRLGADVARVGVLAWGMRVVCWSENLTQERADKMAVEMGLPVTRGDALGDQEKTFKVVSKEELFKTADVVSLHYVLSDRSRGIVGAKDLELMKESALLINTSRGPLIDETALLETLRKGRIRGAALDVFEIEPLPVDSSWRSEEWGKEDLQSSCSVNSYTLQSLHMGYVEEDVLNTWYEETAENLERWLEGKDLLHRLN